MVDIERPLAPGSVAGTGLDVSVLTDLALKTLYTASNIDASEISSHLGLSLSVTMEIMEFLRRERLCESVGSTGRSQGTLRFSLTSEGIRKGLSALQMSGYVGPAPVPLSAYVDQVRRQSIKNVEFSRQQIEASLSQLVLPQRTLDILGQAVSSKRATLLYGASGNGKTTAALGLKQALSGHILIPYAVEVMRAIIQLYDPSTHEAVDTGDGDDSARPARADRRWVVVKRPAVVAAGELAANHLELVLDDVHKTYEAPIQMKANGGLLVIDDFGRQRLDAVYLLNRWVIPLERHVDHLSLRTGARFEVPFDAIPVFVSNRDPVELADEAFLRRIRYKLEIPAPSTPLFIEILKRECERNGLAYDEAAVTYFTDMFTRNGNGNREMRGCHPRDIVEAIADAARYQRSERALTPSTIDEASRHYFV